MFRNQKKKIMEKTLLYEKSVPVKDYYRLGISSLWTSSGYPAEIRFK